MLEENIMELQQIEAHELEGMEAYINIPYFLLDNEVTSTKQGEIQKEFHEISRYYNAYERGMKFVPEGSNGHYIPSDLRYRKAAVIINKEARFAFANPPTFNINKDDVDTKYKEENATLQSFLDNVLKKTNFNGKIIKALKDCFIGKRIAIVANFTDKISLTFLNSLEFIYETSGKGENDSELTKFITFYKLNDTDNLQEQRWFKKKYTKENDGVYLEEHVYSGSGKLIETVTKRQLIRFEYIPATVVLNDGLTGDYKGVSELKDLIDYEKYYSKLANADMDSERKSMNPIHYTVDASQDSTKNLPTSPGSFWDIQSDDDKPESRKATIGTLEAQMNYSDPLKVTLDRIENEMYNTVDVPNLTNEKLVGIITSGKTIKALYWGLTVRCDEKMLAWGHSLEFIASAIIEGGILYPDSIKRYTDKSRLPDIPFDVFVENNYPLPDDINEEKTMDIAEVESKVMSRKSYLKKWRGLNDSEADEELRQIKYENELLDDSYLASMYSTDNGVEVTYEDVEKNSSPEKTQTKEVREVKG